MVDTCDGALRYTDDQIARLITRLKTLGLYDSTTIIVTSDHGEGFGEHGYFLHAHHLFEEFIHVPLIVKPAKGSKFDPGSRVATPSDTRDLFQSISRLMGVEPGRLGNQGRCSWVSGAPRCEDKIVVSEFGNFGIPRRAVIEGHRKVMYYGPVDKERFMATVGNPAWLPSVSFKDARWMYFDLRKDPRNGLFVGVLIRTLLGRNSNRSVGNGSHLSTTCPLYKWTMIPSKTLKPSATSISLHNPIA